MKLPVYLCALLLGWSIAAVANTRTSTINNVSVSKEFFLPSVGQTVQISFSVNRSGTVTVLLLDPDGFPVRTLAQNKAVKAGPLTLDWDGRNTDGQIVPGESYSLKIDFSSNDISET